jgi:hypothetical protein
MITSGTGASLPSAPSAPCWITEAIEIPWLPRIPVICESTPGWSVTLIRRKCRSCMSTPAIFAVGLSTSSTPVVRNVIAVRPTTVSMMSATTAEAVGICPAPRPWKNIRPTASPTMLTAL